MATSHRQILRSSSIIGLSSFVNILIGLFRTKVAAIVLGPAGVGLIGLIQNTLATGAAVSSLGFGNAGSRQIAEAVGREDRDDIAAARRALLIGTGVLAVVGACIFLLFRERIRRIVFGGSVLEGRVGWLALGVALTVGFGSQNALLVGLRRIGDVGRIGILASILSTAIAVPALLILGIDGVIVFALSAPVSMFILGWFYISRVPAGYSSKIPLSSLAGQWRALISIGAAITVTSLAVSGGELLVRTAVQRELGVQAVGHFQAAWTISMTYIGFILAAMSADYYPRLAGSIRDHASLNRMANEQVEVALLLAGPILTGMMGAAPWVIHLLYSSQFGDAVAVLRWQILGDILKIASWPLGFVLLALGHGRTFMATDCLTIATFVVLANLGLPIIGLPATGIAFIGMYSFYLPVIYLILRRRTGFRWENHVLVKLAILFATASTTLLISHLSALFGLLFGTAAALALVLFAITTLRSALPPKLETKAELLRQVLLRLTARARR